MWTGIGMAAAAVGSALIQNDAAHQASAAQQKSAQQATDAQTAMFNEQMAAQAPFRQFGQANLGTLGFLAGTPGYANPNAPQKTYTFNGQQYVGKDALRAAIAANYVTASGGGSPDNPAVSQRIDAYVQQYDAATPAPTAAANDPNAAAGSGDMQGGYFLHQFNANDLNSNLAPNYEFIKGQGIGATTNQINASGGALSGNALKGVTDYATNLAGNAYQQAFQNYTANQSNIFNRLSTLAGFGSAANTQGVQAATGLAPGIANSIQNAGTASAAGTIGGANALAGGVNNALGWYTLSNMGNTAAPAANAPAMTGGGTPMIGDFASAAA